MPNPTAFITGAARGIGRACALALAREGFDVAAADVLDTADTLKAVEALGRAALGVRCDVASPAERAAALARTRERFGRLNVLVNNAGVAPKVRADILDAGEESYDLVMGINLKGPYFLTQAVARWMLEQKKERPQENFAIINMSSISAYTASPSRGEYCLSKAGVSMMTRLYAARLAEAGICVFEIRPGIVMTDMTKVVKEKYDRLIAEGLTPIRRCAQPEDVAAAVAACASGRLPMTTGQVIDVDGGFHLRVL
jgi:NAD(P)-dependent dehydrogenase (short-subunit alcohol dehydrogenase family)